MGTGPVKRVTIWVRDAEASLRLYRDVLGLEVIEDKRLEGPQIAAIVGLEEVQLRIVHLAPAGATHGWIGLYELGSPQPSVPALAAPPPDRPAYGQATIVLTTDRMQEILPRLHALGVRFLTAPQPEYVKTTPGGPTPAGRYSEAIFFDPDGVPVSLIGYAPL
jgi:catechol 2,3-dioxygenase-like lactoylglutathione lyase family enzyme